MKVPLRELPLKRTFELSTEYVDGLISGLPMRKALGCTATEPGEGSADLDFYIEGDNVFARGRLKAWVELACSRCLVNVKHEIDEEIMVTFLPGGMVPNEDGSEAEEDDEGEGEAEDTYAYEGEEIDVEPLLRERLVLAVPFAPLCKTDCLGLCSACGANRNDSECGCDRKVVDPRLAALKDFKV